MLYNLDQENITLKYLPYDHCCENNLNEEHFPYNNYHKTFHHLLQNLGPDV